MNLKGEYKQYYKLPNSNIMTYKTIGYIHDRPTHCPKCIEKGVYHTKFTHFATDHDLFKRLNRRCTRCGMVQITSFVHKEED